MKQVRPIIFILALFLGFFARGQQDIQLSQQTFSKINFNPAATGFSNYANAYLFARQQWIGFEGAPKTFLFNANTYIEQIRSGVGFSVFNDRNASSNLFSVSLAYAYHIRIGREQYVSFGLSGGIFHRKYGGNISVLEPEIDPELIELLTNGNSIVRPNIDLGITYSTPKLIVGLSATHVSRYLDTKDDFLYKTAHYDWFNLPMHVYLFVEPSFDINKDLKVTPRIMGASVFSTYRNDTLSFLNKIDPFYEIGLVFEFQNKIWIGGNYRSGADFKNGSTAIAMLGINLRHNLRLGVSYDFRFKNTYKSTGEIMLNYRFKYMDDSDQSIDFAPRFFD
jgi:type IX secretion system PorP/SprF family membrane protein